MPIGVPAFEKPLGTLIDGNPCDIKCYRAQAIRTAAFVLAPDLFAVDI